MKKPPPSSIFEKTKLVTMNWNILFSDNIRKAREAKHLSQAEMAQELGISTSAYSRFEEGKTGIVSDNLLRFSEYMGKSPVEILAGGKIEGAEGGVLQVTDDKDEIIMEMKREHARELEIKDGIIESLIRRITSLESQK